MARSRKSYGKIKKIKPYTFEQYSQDYDRRKASDYDLNKKMNRAQFNYNYKLYEESGMTKNSIKQEMREDMFKTSVRQAKAAKTNLLGHLDKWKDSKDDFQKKVIELSETYGVRDLNIADMRKATGAIQNFMDDVYKAAQLYGIEFWSDVIFGS